MSIRIRDIDMRFLSHDLSDHTNAGIVSKGLYIPFQPKCRLGLNTYIILKILTVKP